MVVALEDIVAAINVSFLITMGMIVYLMQAGFAFLEAGSVRAKNTTNILMKNIMDSAVGALAYWALGYAFAFGSDNNGFIGTRKFFLSETDASEYASYFVAYCFAAAASTIVSGALAERTKLHAYLIFTFFMTGFIYPIVSHWVYSDNGWLNELDYIDFAGSSVVHCVGGSAALVGVIMTGPRTGRFKGYNVNPIPGHSLVLVVLGFFILWFGFFAFNAVSEGGITGSFDSSAVARAVVNTGVSGSSATLVSLFIEKIAFAKQQHTILGKEVTFVTIFGGYWSISGAVNGGLTGMVAICAGCNVVEPWAAFVIGAVSACTYEFWARAYLMFHLDDPLNAGPIHLGGGLWGVISVALFAHGDRISSIKDGGVFYAWDRDAFFCLGIQAMGAVTIIAWTIFWTVLLFGSLRILGMLRVSKEQEQEGLDFHNGEPAYPIDFALFGPSGNTSGGSGVESEELWDL